MISQQQRLAACPNGRRLTGYYSPLKTDFLQVDLASITVGGIALKFPFKFIEGWGRSTATGD